MRKMWEKAAQERAAAEAKLQQIRQQMAIEDTLAEIEYEEEDRRLQQEKLKLIRYQEDRKRHRAQRKEEKALEQMRRNAELEKRRRRAEMSMREINAWQDMETARRKEQLLRSKRKSVVRKSTHCNDVLQGTRLALRRNDDAEKRDTDSDEIIREEQVNLETVPVTSKKFGVSQTKKNPAKSDEQSYVAVQRPLKIAVTRATTTNLCASAEASNQRQDMTSETTENTGKVKRPMIDLNLSLSDANVDDKEDGTKMTELATEEDETMLCVQRKNARNAPVTSKNMMMTTIENSSVKCDCLTSVSVQRPEVNNALATNESRTSIEAGMTSERSADTSRDVISLAKVNDCNSAVIDMNDDQIEDSSLPPTLRKDAVELLMYKASGDCSKLHDIWNERELPRKCPQIMCLTEHKLEDWNFARTKKFDENTEGFDGLHAMSASQGNGIKKRSEDIRSVPLKFVCDERVMSVSDVPTTKLRDDELSCLATGAEFRLHKWMAFDYDARKAIELSGQVKPNNWITELGLPDKYIREVSLSTDQDERVLNVDLTRKIPVRNCNAKSVAWLFAQVLAMMIMILSQEFHSRCNLDDKAHHDIHKQLRYWRNDFPALENNCLSRYVKTKVFRDKIPTDYTSANELNDAVRYIKVREKCKCVHPAYVMGHSSFTKLNSMTMKRTSSRAVSTPHQPEVFEGECHMEIDYVHLTESLNVNCDVIENDQQHIMEQMISFPLKEIDNPKKKMIMEPNIFYSTEAEQEIAKCLCAERDASEDEELPIPSRANAWTDLGIATHVVQFFNSCTLWTKKISMLLLVICLICILKRTESTARDKKDIAQQGEIGCSITLHSKAFKTHTRNLLKNLKVRKDILLMRLKLIIDDKDARSLQGRHGNGDLSQRKTALVVWINQNARTRKMDLACRSKWDIGEKKSTYDVIWLMFEIMMYSVTQAYMIGELIMKPKREQHKKTEFIAEREWTGMFNDMYDTKLRPEIFWMKLMTYVSCFPDNFKRFSGSRTKTCALQSEVSRLVNVIISCDLTILLERIRNDGLGTTTLGTLKQNISSPTTWKLWKFRRKPDNYHGPIDKIYVKDAMLVIQRLTDVLWKRRFDLSLNNLHQLLNLCVTDTVLLRKEPRCLTIDEEFSCNL